MSTPDFTFFTAVRAVCALSFATTVLLLLVQLFPRRLTSMRPRVLQLSFAFGLTAVIAVALARADQAPLLPRHLELGLTVQQQSAAAPAQREPVFGGRPLLP